uniref:Uncharacterized protein LOC100186817 n=1 Tax=Phallusia mammillata TaxID=59560 RepID=A0A6F9DIR1_9ASCI|nr:uncharacterized protein LOC100186817 [Phallusia mammillata]
MATIAHCCRNYLHHPASFPAKLHVRTVDSMQRAIALMVPCAVRHGKPPTITTERSKKHHAKPVPGRHRGLCRGTSYGAF